MNMLFGKWPITWKIGRYNGIGEGTKCELVKHLVPFCC